MKVRISIDEIWPVFSVVEHRNMDSDGEIDLTLAELQDINDAMEAYHAAQRLLKQKSVDAGLWQK